MRYLVATGRPSDHGVMTEIVDLTDPSMSCLTEDIPYRFSSAGGLLGKTPVICGGWGGTQSGLLNECLLYGTSQVITMNSRRSYFASVALNKSMLWMMGGWDGNNRYDSTEFITTDGSINGPTLPEAIYNTCAVKFTETGSVYLVGGNNGGSTYTNNVWVANPSNEFSFTQGPSLVTNRGVHACGTMSIGAKSIILAAGGYNNIHLSSVEILDPLSNQWVAGK